VINVNQEVRIRKKEKKIMNAQNSVPNQTQPTNSTPGSTPGPENMQPPAYRDWREQFHAERRAWREQRHAELHAWREARWQSLGWHPAGLFVGIFLILLGLAFMLQNIGLPFLANWWALFILIPAFGAFVAGWDSYQDNKKLTRYAAGSLTVGILLTIVTLVFLFNLAIGIFWPVLLIAGGLALLVIGWLVD
jgi:hypothetical protein